jgi:hypothetical protein
MRDANPGRGFYFETVRRFRSTNAQLPAIQTCAILFTCDCQRLRQLARAVRQSPRQSLPTPPLVHLLQSGSWLQCANENASGATGFLGNHVQTLVHSIDEIYVSASGRTEYDPRPFRDPAICVGGPILGPEIGLYLDNRSRATMVYQNATEQASRDIRGTPRIEREWQPAGGVNQFGEWPGIRMLEFRLVYNPAVFRILRQRFRVEQRLEYVAGRNAPIHRDRLI